MSKPIPVPFKKTAALARQLGITQSQLLDWLGISAAACRISSAGRLSARSSNRFRAITAIIREVERMTESEGGHAGFDAASWTGRWLDSPNPALGGIKPHAYLGTETRRTTIISLLRQSAAGSGG